MGLRWIVVAAVVAVAPLSTGCDECIDGAERFCACRGGAAVTSPTQTCIDGEWLQCDCFGGGFGGGPVPRPPRPVDAGRCGDGFCDIGETPGSCPFDCACGDGFCGVGEARSCPEDCPCGDLICTDIDRSSCPEDCTPDCLAGICGPRDNAVTCPGPCSRPRDAGAPMDAGGDAGAPEDAGSEAGVGEGGVEDAGTDASSADAASDV